MESWKVLTLGELEAFPCAGLAGLFALFHARVAAKVASGFEIAAEFRVDLGDGAGYSEFDRSGLSDDAATVGDYLDIVFVEEVGHLEWCENLVLGRKIREVFFEGPIIDGDLAGTFGEPDAGDGGLAASGCGINSLSSRHGGKEEKLRNLEGLGVLCAVRMLRAVVDLELAHLSAAEAGVWNHAFHGALHDDFGATAAADVLWSLNLLTADVAGVAGVDLLGLLGSGEAGFVGVDDDDEVTSIDVRRENWLMFAAENAGDFDGDATNDLVSGIDDEPFAFDVCWFGRKGFHPQYVCGLPDGYRSRRGAKTRKEPPYCQRKSPQSAGVLKERDWDRSWGDEIWVKSGCFQGFCRDWAGESLGSGGGPGGVLDELGILVRMEAAGSLRHGCDRRFFGND